MNTVIQRFVSHLRAQVGSSSKMLPRLLPVLYLLYLIPQAFSTDLTVYSNYPPALVPSNVPTCHDGNGARRRVHLGPTTVVDCLHILVVKHHEDNLVPGRTFFSPFRHCPYFYRGMEDPTAGCEFAIEIMRFGSGYYMSSERRPWNPRLLDWVDSQVTMSFRQVVRHCVLKNYAGVLFFEGTYNRVRVEFVIRVGLQRRAQAHFTRVEQVYNGRPL